MICMFAQSIVYQWRNLVIFWKDLFNCSLVRSLPESFCFIVFDYLKSILVTVCSCHVTYACQSESTLYSCLNVKELLARSRCEIWRWSDCNWSRTQNHLVLKRTVNHLAKLTFVLVTFVSFPWFCVHCLFSFLPISQYFQYSSSHPFSWIKSNIMD